MTKRLVDFDPHTQTSTFHYYDPSSKKTYVETTQDAKSIIEFNKACQNSPELAARGKKADFMHFARVPNTVLMEWKTKYNVDYNNPDDMPKIERLLSSNEYKYLRTVDKI